MDLTSASTHGELRQFALSFVKNHEEAQDIVQEVLVQVLDQPKSKHSKAYLYKAIRNRSLNKLRSRSRYLKAKQNFSEFLQVLWSGLEGEESPLEDRILGLPAHLREVLILRVKSELSHKEISDVLGIPIGTVKSRINAAIKKMKNQRGEF